MNASDHIRRLTLLALLSTALIAGAAAQEKPTAASLANQAYAVMATQPAEAMSLFRQALAIDTANVLLHRQLGYLCLAQGEREESYEQFTLADRYAPSDTIKLQRAYILASLGRTDEAKSLFKELRESPLPELQQKADLEYAAMTPYVPSRWTHLYAAPYYDTRWKTLFYQAHVQQGFDLDENHRWSVYGKAAVSGDNKSTGGGLAPVVISDNTLLLALGVRYKPFAGMMVDVQEGLAFDLLDKGSGRTSRGDFRAVATYGAGVYAPFSVHDQLTMPMAPFADMYLSAGYYSRYKNGICYGQGRAGLHAVEVSRTSLDVYARVDVVGDTEQLYYNNLVEVGGGARLTPNVDWGVYLIGEYHRGFYTDVSASSTSARALLYGAAYNSVRLFLLFERTL